MTVKQIAKDVAVLIQADDIEELIAADDIADPDVKTLVKCIALAESELNADFPVLAVSVVVAEDGYIPLSAFGGAVSTVRRVERHGRAVAFTFTTRGIGVPSDGEYTVTYTLAPADKALGDELVLGAGVDKQTVTYLAARNYCLITGRADDAAVWDQLFNADAENRRLRRRAKLPKRRFL